MTLAAGTRLGPYEILSPLGAGGMGEVYRARDTRLGREVAIKVLPEHLAGSPDRRARFEREARAVSALSHPHICALYDVGEATVLASRHDVLAAGSAKEADSEAGDRHGLSGPAMNGASARGATVQYLVMELLEGRPLADRIERGPLPTEQVLRFGVEIADALDRAHRAGIVHRDLKPGNIMLTKSGVKLLDFGLAKAMASQPDSSDLSSLPTETARPLTEKGTILGTLQYMSPEQLEGKEADARSDIFAFGCVLYEMATGKKAFTGASRMSLVSGILRDDPRPISTVVPTAPPALDRAVKNCLAKDPDDRWQSAHDVKAELAWIAEAGSQAGAPAVIASHQKSRERLAWIWAAAATLATVLLAFGFLRRSPRPASTILATLPPPKEMFEDFPAFSPDGKRLAFIAAKAGEPPMAWIRTLGQPDAKPIAGSEEASFPFWSPDGKFVAFFSRGALRRVDVGGGPVLQICEAENGMGGTWNGDGAIVFAPRGTSALYRVPASGGQPVPVTKLDAGRHETSHRYPFFLPDGRRFLYMAGDPSSSAESANSIRVGSLDGAVDKIILPVASDAQYANGYVFYSRELALLAQRFDLGSLALRGDAFPIASRTLPGGAYFGYVPFSVCGDLLLYLPDVPISYRLAWFDRSGREIDSLHQPRLIGGNPRLSPGGRRIAATIFDASRNEAEIWLLDAETGAGNRFAYGDWSDRMVAWSPAGDRLAFGSNRNSKGGNRTDIWTKALDGSAEKLLAESADNRWPEDWSPDGRFLSIADIPAQGNRTNQVWVLETFGKHTAVPFETEGPKSGESRFSPDGRWIAYASLLSGKAEVYVKPFPGPGGRHRISPNGGDDPAWRRDGKEIYYLTLDNRLMAVPITLSPVFHAGAPVALFAIHSGGGRATFEPSPDGKKFLVTSATTDANAAPFELVVHWSGLVAKN